MLMLDEAQEDSTTQFKKRSMLKKPKKPKAPQYKAVSNLEASQINMEETKGRAA